MASAPYLDLNFGRRRPRLRPLGAMVLAAGIAGAGIAASSLEANYLEWHREKAANAAAESRVDALLRASRAGTAASPAELREVHGAARVAAQLRTPWAELLQVLETAPVGQVALLSIEPVAADGRLRLSAEAKNLSVMLDYLAFLQRLPTLQQVMLVSHQVRHQAPGEAVRFEIQARWGKA